MFGAIRWRQVRCLSAAVSPIEVTELERDKLGKEAGSYGERAREVDDQRSVQPYPRVHQFPASAPGPVPNGTRLRYLKGHSAGEAPEEMRCARPVREAGGDLLSARSLPGPDAGPKARKLTGSAAG